MWYLCGTSRLNFPSLSLYTVNVIATSYFFNIFFNLFQYLANTMSLFWDKNGKIS